MAKVIFDGVGNMPELGRITAKKNYASSSQSHKMGATAAFNDILHWLAANRYPDLANEVGGRVAVFQHPVYAFEEHLVEGTEDQYQRDFIGLYTVGADKGDKGYFGFSDSSVKSTAIRLEGTDHLKGVGFNYPWEVNGEKKIRYNAAKEALCIVTGVDKTKWTAILEQSACGTAETEEDIEAYLEKEFRPAYECAYNNNPLLVGTDMTIEAINADIVSFQRMRRSDDRPYSYCEFWIDGEYDIYYFNQERGCYEKNGVNLLTDLGISNSMLSGKTIEEKNQLFIKQRVARFKAMCPAYFHKNDAIYQLMFLYMIAASDNGEKNMYPYKMKPLASGSRWRFLQDDLDSIFNTDNQGQDTKPYSVDLHDFTDDTKSAYVFKGEDSALWQLIELAFPEECKQMGRDILQAMYELSSKGTKTPDKLMGFFDDYFFDRAQHYFTTSAYNNDTEYAYEEAWNNKEYVASVDIHPLAQALGAHLSSERAWLQKRIVYLMSKYGFGGYGSNEDTALGIISVRTQIAQGFTLTPAIDSYPTILGGQAQTSSAAEKVKAGTPVALAPVGGGNTNTYIVGADFLSDIGDLKDLNIDPSSVVTLSVASKRLRRLKVGDENPEEVTSYLATLSIQRCDSMESVDARNLQTLVGTVDLSQCPRLIEALFGGTNTTAVIISAGSKIERLQLPDSITTIDLRDNKFLADFDYGTLSNLRFLRLEGTPVVNGFALLKEAYNSEGQQLKDIRLVGFEYNGDATDLDMIANLANDLDKDGNEHLYNGIDGNGNPTEGNPVLEGKLNVDGYVYEDTANVVKQMFPTIEFTPKGYYMRFADPAVAQICATNFGDGNGITEEQAAEVTDIGKVFSANTEITSFDEFANFTGVKTLAGNAFVDCSSLDSIVLPSSVVTLGDGSLARTALKKIEIPNSVESIGTSCFYECKQLTLVTLGRGVRTISGTAFYGTSNLTINISDISQWVTMNVASNALPNSIELLMNGEVLTNVVIPSNATHIRSLAFTNNKNITSVVCDGRINDIYKDAFVNCVNLSSFRADNGIENIGEGTFAYTALTEIILKGTKSIGIRAFQECSKLSIVDIDESVESIGNYAFNTNKSLSQVIVRAVTPPSAGSSLFLNSNSNMTIYVPDQSVQAYRGASGWLSYADRIWPMESYLYGLVKFADPAVEAICVANWDTNGTGFLNKEEAKAVKSVGILFQNNSEIISFDEFEEFTGVTEISNAAFSNCKNLQTIKLPDSVTKIGDYALQLCANLKTVKLPNNLTSIGAGAFTGDSGLTSISIPESVTNIGGSAFDGCSSIKSFNIPYGVTELKNRTLAGCSSLESILLPDGITAIGERAFDSCRALKSVNIPQGVKTIGSTCFVACKSLTFVDIPDSVESIGTYAFFETGLEKVICRPITPPSIGNSGAFSGNYPIYVPDASVDAYKAKENWSALASRIKPLSEYVES